MTGNFQHPFQRIQFLDRRSSGRQDLLVASSGSKIYTYAAESGQRLAVWPQNVEGIQEPPEKKRRVSNAAEPTSEEAKPASEEPEKSPASIAWSNIPLLVASSSGEHVVALTAEDKCVRVFAVGEYGALKQLNARHMPKRPCSIVLGSDDNTILCGDKFGDVYALPLIPGGEQNALPSRTATQPKSTQPAATTLTVHSKRNRRALEQQKQQMNQGEIKTEEKSGPTFEHKAILGHVSLLTDLIFVSRPSDASSGSTRTYILTGDRDEHIRVSRGPPQAHVIENYCLGHTSFISKLCVPEWAPEYLISGGGDNYLLVWNWAESRILQKVPLVDPGSEVSEVAVRGIWAVSLATSMDASETSKAILVALDGSSKLQCYMLEPTGTLKAQSPIQLSGNVLDVTTIGTKGIVVVSVDCVRQAGSTQEWRTSPTSPQTLLESFRMKTGSEALEWEPTQELAATVNSGGTADITAAAEGKAQKELNESVYIMGNLRKKTAEDE